MVIQAHGRDAPQHRDGWASSWPHCVVWLAQLPLSLLGSLL